MPMIILYNYMPMTDADEGFFVLMLEQLKLVRLLVVKMLNFILLRSYM